MNRVASFFLVVATVSISVMAFAQQPAPLEILNMPPPRCVAELSCGISLRARGGNEPYTWRIAGGSLPSGLQLEPIQGVIQGSPMYVGEREAVVEVTDSGRPASKADRAVLIKVLPALTLDWVAPPVLQGTTMEGSVKIVNNSQETMDLTFLIVAVNEIGKAFALGYQHVSLAPETTLENVPFSSQLPGGRYTVRADAIGEIAARRKIFRAAREAGPFLVPVQ